MSAAPGPLAPAEPRTLAPFGRRRLEVTANRELGAYRLISALDPHGPPDPRPGQFYMLSTEERWGGGRGERPYLPRAFSFCRVGDSGGPLLSFLLEDIGPGTARLGALQRGEGLLVTGPLGIGFRPPVRGRPLLAGGGIGVAPLVCWQDELGPGAEAALGFRSADHAEAAGLFAGSPAVATDDGSVGRRALVTELLTEALERDPDRTVYACGPPAMLETVRRLCEEREVPAQLALETPMACGFGACYGCAVRVRGGGFLRLCVDGPVVDASVLDEAALPGAAH